jgi:hypothetical protein
MKGRDGEWSGSGRRAGGTPVVILEMGHQFGRHRDRVQTGAGDPRMCGGSLDRDAHPQQTAVAEEWLQPGGLPADRPIEFGQSVFGDVGDQTVIAPRLLVHVDEQCHAAFFEATAGCQGPQNSREAGQAGLHVAGTPAVQMSAVDLGAERVPVPSLIGGHDIDVPLQQDVDTLARAGQMCPQGRHARRRSGHVDLDLRLAQVIRQDSQCRFDGCGVRGDRRAPHKTNQ